VAAQEPEAEAVAPAEVEEKTES